MPKVIVDHQCKLSPEEAFKKIQTFFENDQDIKRLDASIKCEFKPEQLKGKASGSQFKADISVSSHNSGSSINVTVDLPFLLTPFKGKVQETIQKKLGKFLA